MEDKKKIKTQSIRELPDLRRKVRTASKRPSKKGHRRGAGKEKISTPQIEISKERLKALQERAALSKDPY